MSAWPENPLFPSATTKEHPGSDVWSLSLQAPLLLLPGLVLLCTDLCGPHQRPFMSFDFQLGGPMGRAGSRSRGRRVNSSIDRCGPGLGSPLHRASGFCSVASSPLPSGQERVILLLPAFTYPSATEAISPLWETRFPCAIRFLGPVLTGPLGFPPRPAPPRKDLLLTIPWGVCDASLGEKRRGEILADLWGTEDTGGRKKEDSEKTRYTLGIPFLVSEKPRSSATLSICLGCMGLLTSAVGLEPVGVSPACRFPS